MKSREELQREFAGDPAGLLEYTCQLHEQLNQKEQLPAEARAYIAELKRQLFGPKADKLSPEQEEQLRQLTGDLREQAQRAAPLSQAALEPELPPKDQEKLRREARRRIRHPLPAQLEVQQVVLEPEDKVCGHLRRQRPTVLKRLGCLAHIRRRWYKAARGIMRRGHLVYRANPATLPH